MKQFCPSDRMHIVSLHTLTTMRSQALVSLWNSTQVYVSWYLVIHHQFHLIRISRFPVWGRTLSGLHMASWSNSVGAMVLEFSGAHLWDHNALHYSLPTNFLQDIGKVCGDRGAADMAISHSNNNAGYLPWKSHDTLLIQGWLPRNSLHGHQIAHPGVLLVFLQKYCYPSFLQCAPLPWSSTMGNSMLFPNLAQCANSMVLGQPLTYLLKA